MIWVDYLAYFSFFSRMLRTLTRSLIYVWVCGVKNEETAPSGLWGVTRYIQLFIYFTLFDHMLSNPTHSGSKWSKTNYLISSNDISLYWQLSALLYNSQTSYLTFQNSSWCEENATLLQKPEYIFWICCKFAIKGTNQHAIVTTGK